MSSDRPPIEIYVSPRGSDHWKKNWTGTLPEPNADGTDGPVATLRRAITAVHDARDARKSTDPAFIYLRDGRYALDQTLYCGLMTPGSASRPTKTKCRSSTAG
jgi:hypothetical protein